MNTTEHIHSAVEELLTPVEQSLGDAADDLHHVSAAKDKLREAIEHLEETADEDWRVCARTLMNLLEIVDCFAEGSETLDEEATGEIVEFVKSSLPRLRESLTGTVSESGCDTSDLVAQAGSRWGEYLSLIDSDVFYESASLDTVIVEDDYGFPRSGKSKPNPMEQVHLILSAVQEFSHPSDDEQAETNHVSEVPATSESSHPFNHQRSGDIPAVPDGPQQIKLSDTLLEAYLEDTEQCLSSMERSVMAFENDPQGQVPVNQLCRDLHTLKGASASIGLSELATYLHEIEDWLQSAELSQESGVLQPILECVDFVRAQIDALQQPSQPPENHATVGSNSSPKLHKAAAAIVDRSDEPGEETIRVRSSQLDRMMDLLVSLVIWRRRRDRRVAELSTGEDELSRCVLRLESFAKDFPFTQKASLDETLRESSNPLGEITNDLREIASSLRECGQLLGEENRAVSQFTQQFRQQLAQVRRVPLSGLFQRLQRVVHEAARIEVKQVRLECVGQSTGLERSLQERLYEPLLHLVRNAVCHGIEPAEQRIRAGKDAVGTITLEASGSSQMLLLEISDDGGGLDYAAIRRRGIERGLLRPDEPVSQNELSRLIFHPGFTTRTEATEVAGRGIGMDVVLTALNRCHCQIDVDSEPGTGTRFRLLIPLPSMIEHFLVFRCGGQLFGLPMQFVMSTSQEKSPSHRTPGVPRSGQVPLAELLQLDHAVSPHESRSLMLGSSFESRRSSMSGRQAKPAGSHLVPEPRQEIIVEDILGPEEVVVRPLPPLLRRHPLLNGVTISGAGEAVLLLDGPRLLKAVTATSSSQRRHTETSTHQPQSPASTAARQKLLVADDSLSARRRLVEKLAPYGFDITEASDGVEALDFIRGETFAAVFSDLEMPGLDGFELLSEIKNGSCTAARPVIIVTSRNEPETRSRADELGADGFLSKPVSDSDIETTLGQLVFSSHRFSTERNL